MEPTQEGPVCRNNSACYESHSCLIPKPWGVHLVRMSPRIEWSRLANAAINSIGRHLTARHYAPLHPLLLFQLRKFGQKPQISRFVKYIRAALSMLLFDEKYRRESTDSTRVSRSKIGQCHFWNAFSSTLLKSLLLRSLAYAFKSRRAQKDKWTSFFESARLWANSTRSGKQVDLPWEDPWSGVDESGFSGQVTALAVPGPEKKLRCRFRGARHIGPRCRRNFARQRSAFECFPPLRFHVFLTSCCNAP